MIAQLPDNSIDFVRTDPPDAPLRRQGWANNRHDNDIDRLRPALVEIYRLMKGDTCCTTSEAGTLQLNQIIHLS